MEEEIEELKSTLKTLQASTAVPADPEKRAVAEKDYARINATYSKRRRQFKELWGMIEDAYDGDLAKLWVRSSSSTNLPFPTE
jgi:hypothetical protein